MNREVTRKKHYLDILRILAILLVMYNHSPAYLSFRSQSGLEYEISLFLSMICKAAVPLFFMISGALLLGRPERFSELLKKRFLRCAAALVVFSFLYKVKLAVKGAGTFSLVSFFLQLPCGPVHLPYWYLYSYLGFLLLLPFLRALARNMSKNLFCYLLVLQLLSGCLFPVLEAMTPWSITEFFSLSPVLTEIVFYPLAGYGIDRYLSEKEFRNLKGLLLNASLLLTFFLTRMMVRHDYAETGVYRENCLGVLTVIPALLLFFDFKLFFQEEMLSERMQKLLSFTGGNVFGIYLLDGFIGTGGKMDLIFHTISPFTGFLPAYIAEILCIFVIRLLLVTILKKLPPARFFL